MAWQYRLMAHESKYGVYLQIHEVIIDRDTGKVNSYTDKPVSVGADTIEGAKWVLTKMMECLDLPILYYGRRFPEVYTEDSTEDSSD